MAPPQSEDKKTEIVSSTKKSAEPTAPAISPIAIQVDDKIYDAQTLASTHPGGELFVQVFAGRDATEAFLSYHRKRFPHTKVTDALLGTAAPLKAAEKDDDYLELCKLVEAVLPRSEAYAPWSYWCKLIALLSSTLALEWYIHSHAAYHWYLTGPLGLLFAWVGMNIQHDANHGSISPKAWINRTMGMTQNWIGGSAIDWIHQHDVQHHIFPNNVTNDPDIVGNDLLRLNPIKPLASAQALQHVYIFLLLAVFGMTYIGFSLVHLVEGFHFTKMSKLIDRHRPFEEATIVFFLLRWIALPLYQVPAWSTFLNVLPLFVVGGYYLAFFFIISHNFEGSLLYTTEQDKEVEESFLRKQVATAANVGGSWLAFVNGGLNYQIEHHLFPRIQHTHYPRIAPVVRAYCEKKGVPYKHFATVSENVWSCVRHLKQMGTQQVPNKGYVPK